MYTQNNIKAAETAANHQLMANFKADKSDVATPRNYVVPDFGIDREIGYAQDGLQWAEKDLGKKWNFVKQDDGTWASS